MSGPFYTVHLMLTLEVEAPDEELARISAKSQVNNSFNAGQLPDVVAAKVVDSYPTKETGI